MARVKRAVGGHKKRRAIFEQAKGYRGSRGRHLRAAHEQGRARDLQATDDAQLVEQYGGTVVVVEGARSNLKLTRPEDFDLAEALLRA